MLFQPSLVVTVCQNGKMFRQEFQAGIPEAALKVVGPSDKHGTEITFYADPDYF